MMAYYYSSVIVISFLLFPSYPIKRCVLYYVLIKKVEKLFTFHVFLEAFSCCHVNDFDTIGHGQYFGEWLPMAFVRKNVNHHCADFKVLALGFWL
jgi:hypothetical protein